MDRLADRAGNRRKAPGSMISEQSIPWSVTGFSTERDTSRRISVPAS